MTITQVGGDGDDDFEIDETAGEIILGGAGNDRFSLNGESATSIDAGTGLDTLSISGYLGESIDMRAFAGLENLEGAGNHTTVVFGNALNNHISAVNDSSNVTMHGLGGNDTLIGGSGADSLLGGDGDDSLAGGDGVADDTLDGGAGHDTADGGVGNDTLLNAEVTPPAGSIRIIDRILTADGGWGSERITIERTGTDDVIVRIEELSRQFDMDDFDGVLLRGNNGYDFLQIFDPVAAGSLVRRVTLEGGNGNDTLDDATNADNDEVMRGGAGDDHLNGWSGNDALFGGTGNDFLRGGTGLDFLDGGDDDDFLAAEGDGGGDTAQGGNGFDRATVDAGDETVNVEELV
jgi:Ca2+-binding RTX toxin-like protein